MSVQTRYFDEDGKIIINRSPELSNAFWILTKSVIWVVITVSRYELAGSIPFVVIEMWMKECGAKLGSEELNDTLGRKTNVRV